MEETPRQAEGSVWVSLRSAPAQEAGRGWSEGEDGAKTCPSLGDQKKTKDVEVDRDTEMTDPNQGLHAELLRA